MKKKLEGFEKKYLAPDKIDYYSKYYRDAVDIIADIKYLKEHIKRTKTNKRFDFTLIPSSPGIIYDYFIKNLFFSFIQSSGEYSLVNSGAEDIIDLLKICDISRTIFNCIEDHITEDLMESNILRATIIDLLELDKVSLYYANIKISEYYHGFFGCSWQCENVKKYIEEMKNIIK